MTNAGAFAEFVACPSAGDCSVIGGYTATDGNPAPFTVTEKNGTWGKAHAIPGLNRGTGKLEGLIESMGCTSAGNCVAGGESFTQPGPIAVSEKNGVWGHAEVLPGTVVMNVQVGDVDSISCTGHTCLGVGDVHGQHRLGAPPVRGRGEERRLGHRQADPRPAIR